jgi:hypothetical protein
MRLLPVSQRTERIAVPTHILGVGGEDLAKFVKGLWTAVPDFSIELLSAGEIEPGVVAHHWVVRGTDAVRPDGSKPTGRAFTIQGASIIQLEGDKIRSDQAYFDRKALDQRSSRETPFLGRSQTSHESPRAEDRQPRYGPKIGVFRHDHQPVLFRVGRLASRCLEHRQNCSTGCRPGSYERHSESGLGGTRTHNQRLKRAMILCGNSTRIAQE